ncbi:DegT/DnrJ/EryC1/StrS family aminotransferase [Paraburkholderia domus]|uniref:DegT/DnrJ/EryC1/StrS family aminotransferase n=1 Tax=Paraburkholderia domus TaxID=2793075 RepID=UPI001B074B1B|nr:DegT/DnrJ/EryC1/StrS family aminotransferase [Paraburkholderia domus]CAE6726276.1 dTDP-4-amino-4,6-dideoxy-D-glucose transaminase [Paraburkholderia domus]
MSNLPIKVLVPLLPSTHQIEPYFRKIDVTRTYSNFGPLATEFAKRLGKLAGAASVTLTSNGTSAIEIALRLKALPGRKLCVMPSFTFVASAHAVCNGGLTPVFVDIDPVSLVLTPEIVERVLPQLPEQPAAVLVISAFGAPIDQQVWAQFQSRTGIPVVFDAAAAISALSNVGNLPVCVSLHATKVLGIGEGGAILNSDAEFEQRATAMTGFGFMGMERMSAIRGGNYRISEYAAAVGLAALDVLPAKIEMLRNVALAYRTRLEATERRARLQAGAGDWVTMSLNIIVESEDVEATLARLDAQEIQWRHWWGLGCHRHPAFADCPSFGLEVTDKLAPTVIGVPCHDGLSDDDLDRIVACFPQRNYNDSTSSFADELSEQEVTAL